jgi:hypothetical protein
LAPSILNIYGSEPLQQMRGLVLSEIFENGANKIAQK